MGVRFFTNSCLWPPGKILYPPLGLEGREVKGGTCGIISKQVDDSLSLHRKGGGYLTKEGGGVSQNAQ